jgi:hypothetical protein
MANYVLKSGSNLLKSGNYILTSSSQLPDPALDINPELWSYNNLDVVDGFPIKPGGSNFFIEADAAKKGIYHTNILNGKPGLRFDGSNDRYNGLIAIAVKTIFLVAKIPASNPNGATVFGGISGFGGFVGGSNSVFGSNDLFGSDASNRLFLNAMRAEPITAVLRQNNFVLLTLDVNSFTGYISIIGNSPDYIRPCAMDLVRMIAYPTRLTEVQRVAKENELLTYYNL